jgi:hypothetical protein
VTMEAVEQAIVGAGSSLGWKMTPMSRGKVLGTLALREHRAEVEVTYDTKTYSIRHKDSQNLNFSGDSIHKNYNGWIQNLERAIRQRLA